MCIVHRDKREVGGWGAAAGNLLHSSKSQCDV